MCGRDSGTCYLEGGTDEGTTDGSGTSCETDEDCPGEEVCDLDSGTCCVVGGNCDGDDYDGKPTRQFWNYPDYDQDLDDEEGKLMEFVWREPAQYAEGTKGCEGWKDPEWAATGEAGKKKEGDKWAVKAQKMDNTLGKYDKGTNDIELLAAYKKTRRKPEGKGEKGGAHRSKR